MSEVDLSKELELLTTSDLLSRFDKIKEKISVLDEEISLIYLVYRKRLKDSEAKSND